MEPMAEMEAEMKLRNFSPRTQREYLRVVRAFSKHFDQAPEELGAQHVREYLLDVRDQRKFFTQGLWCGAALLHEPELDEVRPFFAPFTPRWRPSLDAPARTSDSAHATRSVPPSASTRRFAIEVCHRTLT